MNNQCQVRRKGLRGTKQLIAENPLSSSPELTTDIFIESNGRGKIQAHRKVRRAIDQGSSRRNKVRDDCYELVRIMKKATGAEPVIWAGNIIGFGKYHYVYDSGHEGDACLTGFAVRKQNITLYVMPPDLPERDDLLKKLGKHKASKGCIYLKKLVDIDTNVLEKIIVRSTSYLKKKYPS